VPATGGAFEVTVDGKLLFSKLKLHRFPDEGEILRILADAKH
jgi:selT/selW/selH-like putative selenoprotein